jgi:hypothetical protein
MIHYNRCQSLDRTHLIYVILQSVSRLLQEDELESGLCAMTDGSSHPEQPEARTSRLLPFLML